MSKTMNWAWDCAEQEVDNIIKKLKDGVIDIVKAKNDILNVQNLELVGIDEYNVSEVIQMELENN